MFSKKKALFLYSSWCLFFSLSLPVHSSLLTDPDGLDISLFNDGSATNAFGPDAFTMGYKPGEFGNVIPGPLPDESEMEVSFFDSSISFTQITFFNLATTLGWTMTIDDIDWPDGSEIVSANVLFSNYPIDLSTGFTANSLTIRYDGGEAISVDDAWQGTVSFDVAQVPVPPLLSLFMLGLMGLCFKRQVTQQ